MMFAAPAILYALFVWWFSTGLVLMLVLRRPKHLRAALAVAALLFPVCLAVLAWTAARAGVLAAYAAFTAAIALWGTQEVAFLTGFFTGPRPRPCPPNARGFDRFCYAVSAILYHEVALVVTGAAVLLVTSGQMNQVGAMTFLVLWIMRLSAKLNLFLGVPVLNDDLLPERISFIRSYFRRGPANAFLPLAMFLSAFLTWIIVETALDASTNATMATGGMLVAALLGLAILEHIFMLIPLPLERVWQWSTRAARKRDGDSPRGDLASRDLERVMPTRS